MCVSKDLNWLYFLSCFSNSANGLCERSQCIKRWFLGTKAMRGYRRAASLHKRKPIWHDNRTTNGSSKWSKSMWEKKIRNDWREILYQLSWKKRIKSKIFCWCCFHIVADGGGLMVVWTLDGFYLPMRGGTRIVREFSSVFIRRCTMTVMRLT